MKQKMTSCRALLARIMVVVFVVCSALSAFEPMTVEAASETLMQTYGRTYGYSGTCINLYQLRDANTLNQLKKHYNSITLENEMKPDALLGSYCKGMTVAQAKAQGYYIPSNYKESTVPTINFNTVDEVMKICYQNGLKMRAHTLVWHSQTPTWFFRNNYSGNGGFVSQSVMDARLEMYVKTVMNHVYTSQYGSVVYAWDVANEILHAQNSGWEAVYGKTNPRPAYVKKAFQYAYDTLSYFGLTNSVGLFYNDFNTYMEVNDVITLVNYINSGKKICNGVGMQSHLGTNFPSVDYYMTALNSFLRAGFEVQITEMDITNSGDSNLATYVYNLYKQINTAKKNGGKITSITWWGLSDQTTWIKNAKPLLFSTPYTTKPAYDKYIQAYKDVFGSNPPVTNPSNPNPSQPSQPSQPTESVAPGNTVKLADGWYYIKNVNAQKYVTVAGNTGKAGQNVELRTGSGIDGQKWYLTNVANGYVTLKSALGNFMLDIANGSAEDGANLIIYNAYSGDAQQFMLKSTSTNGAYIVATKASKGVKVLDDYEHSKADGANVCQWKYYGNPNQLFVFEKVNNQSTGGSTQPTQPTNPPATTGSLKAEYQINNWGSGYQVSFKIKNESGSRVNTWTLTIPKSQLNINASWNVNIKESGSNYVITPVSWNSVIENGASVEFGVQGSGSIGTTISCTVK